MSCPGLDLLSPFRDGELPPQEAERIARHLRTCPQCARIDAALGRVEALVRSQPGALLRRRRFLAAAAALLLACGAGILVLSRGLSERPAPLPPSVPPPLARLAPPPASVAPDLRAMLRGPRAREALALVVEQRDRSLAGAVAPLLEDPGLREEAARALGALRGPAAAAVLERALGRGAPVPELARALARTGSARSFERLLAAEREPARRAALLAAAAGLDPPQAAAILLPRLREAAARTALRRARARILPVLRTRLRRRPGPSDVAALGLLGDSASVDRLVALLDRRDLRDAATRALLAIGGERAFGAVFDARRGAEGRAILARGLASKGAQGERFLLDRMEKGSFLDRRRAIALLSSCGTARAVTRLGRLLSKAALAKDSLAALGLLGRREPSAIALLGSQPDRPALRRALIEALGSTGRAAAVPALLRRARDQATTRAVIAALSRIEAPEAVRAIARFQANSRWRREAAEALRHLDPELVRASKPGRPRKTGL